MSSERRIAILIGNSEFPKEPSLSALRCPQRDVEGLAAALTTQETGLFDDPLIFINEPHHAVLPAVNRVFKQSSRQDQILIYYSGHGKQDSSGSLHLATADTEEDALETTSIAVDAFRRLIDNCACKKVALILDCCFSGAVSKDFLKGSVDDQLRQVSVGRGIYILTASTATQTAREKEDDKYSLFTKHILHGLTHGEADQDDDGLVSMDDLYEYARARVPREAPQHPMKWAIGIQGGEFFIARAVKIYSSEQLDAFHELINSLYKYLPPDVSDQAIQVIRAKQPKHDKEFLSLLESLNENRVSVGEFISGWQKFGLPYSVQRHWESVAQRHRELVERHQQEAERQVEAVRQAEERRHRESDSRQSVESLHQPSAMMEDTAIKARVLIIDDDGEIAAEAFREIPEVALKGRELSENRADFRSDNDDNVSLTDDDVFARYQHLIESHSSSMATFHQLPPPLPELIGRSAELVELYAARANHDVRVMNVQGPSGAGKTTLALKLADQLKPQYPDAQFYLDLKGASPQPLSVVEAQSAVIRAYLPTVCLPENEVELDRLYHSVLMGKRALLLLDNAAGAQQVAPLVGPDGCITIVTARDQIALPGTFSKQLESLSPSEARAFLMRIVPHIAGQATKVAELCKHFPLALRLAASTLLTNPDLKVSDYVQRMETLQWADPASDKTARGPDQSLSTARSPFHPVDAVLNISYDLLVPTLQKLWRMLAVFYDTFDVSAAASVWQIAPVRTNNSLDRLMAYSLIERNRATGRYRLHDLAARFAETRSNEQEMTIARQRFSAHYQSVLHEADALYEQGGESLRRGLGLVDLEWNNIQDGQVWAATHVDADHAARELCNSYPDAGKYVLELRQRPRERIRWSEAALTAAQKLNQRNAAVRHLVALGDSYNDLSEVHHAIGYYEQALEIAREACDRRGEAEALSGLGAAHYLGGGLKRACDLHREALELFSRVGPRRREADSLGNLGLAYFATGDLRNALVLFDQQLKAAREISDRRGESQALSGLGTTHYAMGDAEKAAELFNQQLAITREIGDRRGEASALGNVGSAYAALKRYRQAIACHEQSLLVAREIGDRRGEASALGGLGIDEYLDGNLNRSIELLNKQLRLASELGDRRGEAIALSNLGEAYVASGDYQTAIDMLTSAFNLASQIGDIQAQANALFNLGLALDHTGDRKHAIAKVEIALELFEIAEHPYAQVVKERLIKWGAR
jgi:tetratricopeptide (TPR) repeat protein